MSDINSNNEPMFEPETEEEYSNIADRKAAALKQFEERWSIENGLNPYASPLGESLSPKTTKSYEKLNRTP